MDTEKLAEILKQHTDWLNDVPGGKRAYLSGANLGGANLRGANLRGANLSGANLSGAKLNWTSHDLIAEIILRSAGDDIEKRKIAGLILISRDWCWKQFLAVNDPLTAWALGVLHDEYSDGDAPEAVRNVKPIVLEVA